MPAWRAALNHLRVCSALALTFPNKRRTMLSVSPCCSSHLCRGKSMSDLLDLIGNAWETTVKPLLENDPDELARRLARLRSGMLRRPPRAWCLAVRASDQWINPATVACVPE